MSKEWKKASSLVDYDEWRTIDQVKVYHQKRTVDYADYKVGMWYISPFDLKVDGKFVIVSKRGYR